MSEGTDDHFRLRGKRERSGSAREESESERGRKKETKKGDPRMASENARV